jgi:hypothetical protein
MNSYMDYVHEMADRSARVAEERMKVRKMSVRDEDRHYHGLRARMGAYLIRVGQALSEPPVAGAGRQSPSAA